MEKNETPIFDEMVWAKSVPATAVESEKPVAWWKKFLNPTFRRWAYGVTAAGIVAYATITKQPEVATVIAPLIMAIYFVDSKGEPRA